MTNEVDFNVLGIDVDDPNEAVDAISDDRYGCCGCPIGVDDCFEAGNWGDAIGEDNLFSKPRVSDVLVNSIDPRSMAKVGTVGIASPNGAMFGIIVVETSEPISFDVLLAVLIASWVKKVTVGIDKQLVLVMRLVKGWATDVTW